MAASFIRRGYPSLRQATNVYFSIFNSNSRYFSSSKDENDNSDVLIKSLEELTVGTESIAKTSPSITTVPVTTSSSDSDSEPSTQRNQNGAVEKFFKIVKSVQESEEKEKTSTYSDVANEYVNVKESFQTTFATMFRKSKFVSLGDISGRVVEGKVVEVMEDDLYIDFGGKFHCVCPRPKRNPKLYHRGTKVLVSLQAMEMSSAFLGSDIHVTLLEADGTLLGLADSRSRGTSTARTGRINV